MGKWGLRMGDQAGEDVVRRAYQAFNEGDGATLTEVFAEDAVWHAGGDNAVSGTFESRDATFGMFAQLAELTDASYHVEPEEVSSDGDEVTARHRATAKRGDKALDQLSTIKFTLSGGRIVEASETLDDQAAFDSFIA
jgi:ketosteroid isomerase-like protein